MALYNGRHHNNPTLRKRSSGDNRTTPSGDQKESDVVSPLENRPSAAQTTLHPRNLDGQPLGTAPVGGRSTGRHSASNDASRTRGRVPQREHGMSRRHFVATLVGAGAVVTGVVAAGGFAFRMLSGDSVDVTPGQAVTVTIPSGSSAKAVASILGDAGVISNTSAFLKALSDLGLETSIKPGTYDNLTTGMDTDTLITALVAGPPVASVTIAEGLTVVQTAEKIATATDIASADFIALAADAPTYASTYSFLDDVYDNSLEGFLFPKTYALTDMSSAEAAIRKMLNQFSAETASLDLTFASNRGFSLFDVVTAASIIEKEAPVESQRTDVASVIYNRIAAGMKLQMDPTVIYALGDSYTGNGTVTYEDLEVDSPYNTYIVSGLPAGPICSPSLSAITAAANPNTTDYLYYVSSDLQGNLIFSATYDEFQKNVAAYEALVAAQPSAAS
jgi:UPF0755 protein